MIGLLAGLAARAVARHGLLCFGAVPLAPGESLGPHGAAAGGAALLIGNAGPAMFRAFRAAPEASDGGRDPLDRWTRRVVAPVACALGARPVHPSEGPPYAPVQRWLARTGRFHPSPIGLAVHADYGLWHAFRAALVIDGVAAPAAAAAPSPCEGCAGRPCLSACPVGAFGPAGYDVAACRDHVASGPTRCAAGACLARHACPVGHAYAYAPEQAAFHMAAFAGAKRS